jgi:branched-chain amino acid transport system substrate-binding protein
MRTRRSLSIATLIAAVLVTAVVALVPAAAQKGPIRIGFLAPLTGGAAQAGRDSVNGFTMYLEEVGHQIAGRKVEVIVEDTAGNPASRTIASTSWPARCSPTSATRWPPRPTSRGSPCSSP